ncbi:hypothetical protein X772_28220 [Mesorhizobium sp. LSJC280B00]|nr:hypothetical protein X772_28220 [Mesorhizobium sp. LSJC280B00]
MRAPLLTLDGLLRETDVKTLPQSTTALSAEKSRSRNALP